LKKSLALRCLVVGEEEEEEGSGESLDLALALKDRLGMVLTELGGLELKVSGNSLMDAWPLNWKPSPLLKKRFRVACIFW
jgi:hypothetical protein